MAVAMCQSAPALPHAQSASACAAAAVNERFYKFGTPSPPSLQQPSPPVTEYSYRSELEDSGFHSDEEIQKVRQNKCLCVVVVVVFDICGWVFAISVGDNYTIFVCFARVAKR